MNKKLEKYYKTATPEQVVSELEALGVDFVRTPKRAYRSKILDDFMALGNKKDFEKTKKRMFKQCKDLDQKAP